MLVLGCSLLGRSVATVIDNAWVRRRSSWRLTNKHKLILNQIAKFVHKLLISLLLVNSLSSFHSLGNKSMSSIKHHSLREGQLRLSFRLQIHSEIVEFVKFFSILLQCFSLRRSLLEDMFLRVEENIKVCEVEPLIYHFLNLFLSFGREFSTIDVFTLPVIIVDFRAAIISVTFTLSLWCDIVFKKW